MGTFLPVSLPKSIYSLIVLRTSSNNFIFHHPQNILSSLNHDTSHRANSTRPRLPPPSYGHT